MTQQNDDFSSTTETYVAPDEGVVITPEDCSGAAEFWTNFGIPMPPELKKAFDSFRSSQTVKNQQEIKVQICRAIVDAHDQHEVLKDEIFKEIIEECKKENYKEFSSAFDAAVEKKLLDNK